MNAINCTSCVDHARAYLSRQLILARDDCPFGSEIRTHRDFLVTPSTTAPCQSRDIYSEALMQTRLNAFALKDLKSAGKAKGLNRSFVRIEQTALIDDALTKKLLECGETLHTLDQTLVITLNELPHPAINFFDKKKMLSNVYQLKDQGVEFAHDSFNINYESIGIFTTLNLFEYIKISLSTLDLSLKLTANPELFNRIYEHMTQQTQDTKVAFIADRVEHAASHVLARALPFDYFQGSHYSPADNL
jgi:EAL domain-containing protein (putative c-di-GMP-specific phosphodiesterase class I)